MKQYALTLIWFCLFCFFLWSSCLSFIAKPCPDFFPRKILVHIVLPAIWISFRERNDLMANLHESVARPEDRTYDHLNTSQMCIPPSYGARLKFKVTTEWAALQRYLYTCIIILLLANKIMTKMKWVFSFATNFLLLQFVIAIANVIVLNLCQASNNYPIKSQYWDTPS